MLPPCIFMVDSSFLLAPNRTVLFWVRQHNLHSVLFNECTRDGSRRCVSTLFYTVSKYERFTQELNRVLSELTIVLDAWYGFIKGLLQPLLSFFQIFIHCKLHCCLLLICPFWLVLDSCPLFV